MRNKRSEFDYCQEARMTQAAIPTPRSGQGTATAVIIPSVNSYDDLDGCLKALAGQKDVHPEIYVVDRLGPYLRHFLRQEHPGVHVLPVPGDTTIPQMRATGIRRALADNAQSVAVIEDHVIVPPDWAARMLAALNEARANSDAEQGDAVAGQAVGGPIENAATDGWIDWSAFLCEYSSTLPPLPAGSSDWLPGNNVLYDADLLRQHDALLDEGKWENRLHDAIRAEGGHLTMRPDIVAGHKMHYTFRLYMSQRFLYSRSYAGTRRDDQSPAKRLVMGAAALIALPPVMFARVFRQVWRKNYHRRELIQAVPLLVPFCVSWGAGEAVGYWFGPGRAMSLVR
jgi:glycosyl transferase family 2